MRIPAFSFLLTILLEITSISGHLEDDYNYFRRPLLQDLVTWDERSFFIRGERMMLYSGEFHPFRLPVPGLWLDVFQKIKAMGFNTVSFYTDWGLLEGTPGRVLMNGIFSLEPFFKAASEAGIYLIARPGPYINAETTAGGFPGWTLRINGTLRSTSPNFLNATENYVSVIGKIVAKAQITNGGPVILVQPENEYGSWPGVSASTFPNQMNREYISYVNQQYRDTGIVVPFINNDNYAIGSFAPGTGLGEVDIYGIDAYPMRYDCANPNIWPTYRWPEGWNRAHIKHSPTTPFAIPEFQGGSGTSWEGVNQDMCNELVNEEAVRVFHKHTYSFGVKLLNIYMTFGGTNWGNLGFMGGDTSYDYGAAISENRQVFREKYSETKLQANFFKVSPAYLTSVSGDASNTAHTNSSAITVTPLIDSESKAQFLIVRHAEFTSRANTSYELIVTTMIGNFTIPQLGGHLSLQGRDSKIHVIDYNVGGIRLVYSTAEILSWAKSKAGTTVLLVYGGFGETHEIMVATQNKPRISEGSGIKVSVNGVGWVLEWDVVPQRRIVVFEQDKLEIHLLWRNDAYNHWILELPLSAPVGNYSSPSKAVVIVRGGHLMRHAEISGNELRLIGDVNATTDLEIIYEPTEMMNRIVFNEVLLDTAVSPAGKLRAAIDYVPPDFPLPDFARLPWAYLDSLPELQSSYDDSLWTSCNHTTTTNPKKLKTPISLYASDYGYHSGSLIYRGHFFSHGNESYFTVTTAGGFAFAHSIWLNNKFVKSWTGRNANQSYSHVIALPPGLQPGQSQVITILIDHMGQDEEAPGTDSIKAPLGILGYSLSGHHDSDITWKMTGNFGGEDYQDLVRGPRNEGAMFAERQGFHLPNPPSSDWTISNPIHDGISKAGVGFFTTSFELHVPAGYDVPMNFLFAESVKRNEVKGFNSTNYRCQLFVNGYQFGKYSRSIPGPPDIYFRALLKFMPAVSNLGPQNKFPVPEGILNYNGTNWVAVSLWALDEGGARLGTFMLEADRPVMSGYQRPDLAPQPRWERRKGAY